MRYYQRANNVRLKASAGLPILKVTPEGRMIGNVPGWNVFISPDFVNASESTVRNRAAGIDCVADNVIISELMGNPMLFSGNTGGQFNSIKLNPGVAINPDEWSFVILGKVESNETSSQSFSAPNNSDADVIAPRVGFTNTGSTFRVYENGSINSPFRLSYVGDFHNRSTPTLLIVTFSVKNGLKIFDNRQLVAAAPDDKRPLNNQYGANHWSMLGPLLRGYWGMCGQLNIDLGDAENESYRNFIEDLLIEKYSVA